MKQLSKLSLIISLFLILITPQLALAHEDNQGSVRSEQSGEVEDEHEVEDRREELKERAEERLKERKERLASKAAAKKAKLEAVKQKVCEKKSAAIIKRSNQLAARAEHQLNKFTSIADKVKNYYLNKLVPKGVTVANYDDLLADIEARKQEVKDAIDAAKEAAANFDCTGDDPKGELESYRFAMQDAIAALKDFRTSIKNLIVAIRTASAKQTATSSAESGE